MRLNKTNPSSRRFPMRTFINDFWRPEMFSDDDWALAQKTEMPAVNISEEKEHFVIEVAAPGLTKDDFEVVVDQGVLHVSAHKTEQSESEKAGYMHREFNYNSFERAFTVPEHVDANTIDAKYTDGVLSIVLNKKEISVPVVTTIDVQ